MRVFFLFLILASSGFAKERIDFISHAGAGDPFWNVAYNGLRRAAEDFNVDVVFMAPETPNDVAREVELFESALASKPRAIAISVPSDLSFARGLWKAKTGKIPVVVVNSKPDAAALPKNPYLAFVGMDDFVAGKRVAERALQSGKIRKQVLIANHQPGHLGLEQRLSGLSMVFEASGVHVDKLDISDDPANVTNTIQSYLNANPETSGVFCLGPTCVHAIGRHFKREGRPLYLATFDLSPFTVQLIKEGIVAFAIDQQPYKQGYAAVEQLVHLLREGREPRHIETASSFVDRANADQVFDLVKKGMR